MTNIKPSSSLRRSAYDLIVLGSGPGGQRAAVQAAKLGKSVLVIEKNRLGGACLHLGTIPSKALRESALASGSEVDAFGRVLARAQRVIVEERQIIEEQLRRNSVEFIIGTGSFTGLNEIVINKNDFARATKIVIATGTRPCRPSDLDFDGVTLFDSDTILSIQRQPRTLLVIGAGVIGCEYASICARMGVKVTLIDGRSELLKSMDQEIVVALVRQFEKAGIELRLNTVFHHLACVPSEFGGRPTTLVELSGPLGTESRVFDAILYCGGRSGNHEALNLMAVGLQPDERGTLKVNRNYQTEVPHIYAVGDIIGSPALAASSAEQGRLAVLHAFTGQPADFPETFPYGVYTIPEISSVGFQEAQLAKRGIKYVVGKAHYHELARGKMLADDFGFLKLVVHAGTRRIVGVHVIGTSATELVHIGQVAMAFGATIEFFVENVFNYPTLAEAYKVAAYNAYNQLRQG